MKNYGKKLDRKTKFYLLIIYARFIAEITMIIGLFIILFLLMKRYLF